MLDTAMLAVSNTCGSMDVTSRAIAILATSQDFRSTIGSLARLGSTALADWCAIFAFENDKTVRRLTDPEGLYSLDLHASSGPGHVLRTGEHEIASVITEEVIESLGLKPAQLPSANGQRPAAYLCLPLKARGRTIGALALMSFVPGKTFSETDVVRAHDLGAAAAVAIDNARLYREAQEANRLKDEFVAMVSHELRTPLTPILGCIHLLRTAKLTEANFQRALEMIERNAQTQVQIVEDLLDASRIISGKLHLEMQSVQINSVVEAAIDSVRSLAKSKAIQIVTSPTDIPHLVDGDPNRLQQIVWNLLSNALKFTPPGGRIEISVRHDEDNVEIRVTDTGVGIPSEFLPFIFDRFRRTDSNTKTRSGLGLGLAIVQHLVELHHGSITAASPGAGHGAVFTLKFPFQARRTATTSPA
jgi:signal transduction histidine kinase